jgi:hypothetical protein
MTNEQRIEELETALENLLENFEEVSQQKISGERTYYVIEVEITDDDVKQNCIINGTPNKATQEAIRFATEVLYDEGYEYDSEDQG